MITDFLNTSRPKEELEIALAVVRDFKAAESTDEWLKIPSSAWAKLEQLEEFLAHMVEGKPLAEDTVWYRQGHTQPKPPTDKQEMTEPQKLILKRYRSAWREITAGQKPPLSLDDWRQISAEHRRFLAGLTETERRDLAGAAEALVPERDELTRQRIMRGLTHPERQL